MTMLARVDDTAPPAVASSSPRSITIKDLSVRYPGKPDRPFTVWKVDLTLSPGKIVGLAGESGCGKSTTATAAIGFRRGGEDVSGTSRKGDIDLLTQTKQQNQALWGNRISYVSQSASQALNPAIPVGRQLAQPLMRHLGLRGAALEARKLELFRMVGVPDPAGMLKRYPFQFSGGQQQRIALAIALCCNPDILILDEPTTGLDVTTQALISKLLRRIVDETRIAVLYVSHDLALLRNLADELAIMYAGEIVEAGPTNQIVETPAHPYTKLLIGLSPRIGDTRLVPGIPGIPPPGAVIARCAFEPRCPHAKPLCGAGPVPLRDLPGRRVVKCVRAEELGGVVPQAVDLPRARSAESETLLLVDQLQLRYPGAQSLSVDGVSFKVRRGQRIGIVGESGSGKSSVLKMIAGLAIPDDGYMRFKNDRLDGPAMHRARQVCREIQLVFQNPDASLNPRHSIRTILLRPLTLFRHEIAKCDREDTIRESLAQVRLPAAVLDRMPSDLSGGQRQRIAIARAFLAKPLLLLCDEVTSALDVSVQATILQMIAEMSAVTGTAVIMVSHDLALVNTMADHVIVMRHGRIVEQQATAALFSAPETDYTRDLLAAIPRLRNAQGSPA